MHRQTAIALDPNLTIEAITRDEHFIRIDARGAHLGHVQSAMSSPVGVTVATASFRICRYRAGRSRLACI